jgi:hypothetical protein
MDYCYWVYCVFFFCCRVIFVNSHTQSEGPQILISQEDPDLIFRPVKMKKKTAGRRCSKSKCHRRFRHKRAAQLRASAADKIDWEANN